MTFKIIAHRGLLHGPDEKIENAPSQIQKALNMGFDVEIDVWVTDDLYLGHDEPTYMIKKDLGLFFLGIGLGLEDTAKDAIYIYISIYF